MERIQEFLIKKNTELLNKYDKVLDEAVEISDAKHINDSDDENDNVWFLNSGRMCHIFAEGTAAHNYFRERISAEEELIVKATDAVQEFYMDTIKYYIDAVKVLSTFTYNESPFVQIDADIQENEEEIYIKIKEEWDEYFEYEVFNPLMENGFSGNVDYNDVPQIVRTIIKDIHFGDYISDRYKEQDEAFKKCLYYGCIGKFDNSCDRNGRIFAYDKNNDNFVYFELGNFFRPGKFIEDGNIDKQYLKDNPNKIWYPATPLLSWVFTESDDPNWDSDWDDMFKGYPEKYSNLLYGETEALDMESIEYEFREGMSSAELLEFIDALEKINTAFLIEQRKCCEVNKGDIKDYVNCFTCEILFYSNEYDLFMASADVTDENGLKTGELSMHCKNYKQDWQK